MLLHHESIYFEISTFCMLDDIDSVDDLDCNARDATFFPSRKSRLPKLPHTCRVYI